jgi:hypothetical protein
MPEVAISVIVTGEKATGVDESCVRQCHLRWLPEAFASGEFFSAVVNRARRASANR